MPSTPSSGSHTSDGDRVPAALDGRLSALLERLVARPGIHHAQFSVVSGDGVCHWSGAAGAAGPDGTPLRSDTPFFIASVTKRFIATLVLQAHERGELDLDDPIAAHLPAAVTDRLHVVKGVDHTPSITVRHLLTHTSGLPDYWDKPRGGGASLYRQLADGHDRTWGLDEVVRMAREEHTPRFAPQDLTADRQRAHYSDTGFQLLIALVEEVGGRSFAALLGERILAPLGLDHTWLPGRSQPAGAVAAPSLLYARDEPRDLPQTLVASNDLFSTAGDLLRFQQALLAGELFERPGSVAVLTERANLLRNMVPIRYGAGTMIFRVGRLYGPGRRPVTLVGHSGVSGSWLFHCPELDVHLAGTIDQVKGARAPFRLMARLLRAWHG